MNKENMSDDMKTKRKKAHLDFMNKCFLEADNIISQSQSQEEYDETYGQGFRHGYWMSEWVRLGDEGIHWNIHS